MFRYYFKNFNLEIINLLTSFNKFYLNVIIIVYALNQFKRFKKFVLNFSLFRFTLPKNLDRRRLFKLKKKKERLVKFKKAVNNQTVEESKYFSTFNYVHFQIRIRTRKWWWSYVRSYKGRSELNFIVNTSFIYMSNVFSYSVFSYYRASFQSIKKMFWLYRCFYRSLYRRSILFSRNEIRNKRIKFKVIFDYKYYINYIFYNIYFFYITIWRFKAFFFNFIRLYTVLKYVYDWRFFRFKYNKKVFFNYFRKKKFYGTYYNIVKYTRFRKFNKKKLQYATIKAMYLFYNKYNKYIFKKRLKKRLFLIIRYVQNFIFKKDKLFFLNIKYFRNFLKFLVPYYKKKKLFNVLKKSLFYSSNLYKFFSYYIIFNFKKKIIAEYKRYGRFIRLIKKKRRKEFNIFEKLKCFFNYTKKIKFKKKYNFLPISQKENNVYVKLMEMSYFKKKRLNKNKLFKKKSLNILLAKLNKVSFKNQASCNGLIHFCLKKKKLVLHRHLCLNQMKFIKKIFKQSNFINFFKKQKKTCVLYFYFKANKLVYKFINIKKNYLLRKILKKLNFFKSLSKNQLNMLNFYLKKNKLTAIENWFSLKKKKKIKKKLSILNFFNLQKSNFKKLSRNYAFQYSLVRLYLNYERKLKSLLKKRGFKKSKKYVHHRNVMNYKFLLFNKSLYFRTFLRIFNLTLFAGVLLHSDITKKFIINIIGRFFSWKKSNFSNFKKKYSFMQNSNIWSYDTNEIKVIKDLFHLKIKRWTIISLWWNKAVSLNYSTHFNRFFKNSVQLKLISGLSVLNQITLYEMQINLVKLVVRKKRRWRRKTIYIPYYMKSFLKHAIQILTVCLKLKSSKLLADHIAQNFSTTKKRNQWRYLNTLKKIIKAMTIRTIIFAGFQISVIGKINCSRRTKSFNFSVGFKKQCGMNSFSLLVNFSCSRSFHLFGVYSVKIWFYY